MPKVKTCQALDQGLRCSATFGLEEETYYGDTGQGLFPMSVEVWLCPKHRNEPVEPAKVGDHWAWDESKWAMVLGKVTA